VLVFWRVKNVLLGTASVSSREPPAFNVTRLKRNGGASSSRGRAEQLVQLAKHEEHPAVLAPALPRVRDMRRALLLAVLLSIAAGILKVDAMFYALLYAVLGIEYCS
jgi:hypothetical protein